MRKRLKIVLLSLGVVAGYGAGFAHLAAWHHYHRRAAIERHIADVCADAALRANSRSPTVSGD
jgi:hypothetical protein